MRHITKDELFWTGVAVLSTSLLVSLTNELLGVLVGGVAMIVAYRKKDKKSEVKFIDLSETKP